VVAPVVEVLGRYCDDLTVPGRPETAGAAAMWHLSSRISGHLADPSVSALDLLAETGAKLRTMLHALRTVDVL
jgi:isochorismate synthase